MIVSAWERQRFAEAEVASNGVASLLRLGLADELDSLQRDLAAVGPPLDAAQAKSKEADVVFGDIRQQLVVAAKRAALIKDRYGNTAADEDQLRYLLLDRYRRTLAPDRNPSKPEESTDKAQDGPATPPAPPAGGPEGKKP